MGRDLRSFLEELRRMDRELAEVRRPIRPHRFEVTALLRQLEQLRRYPAVLFTKPTDLYDESSSFALLSNLFATRERCARALGLDPARPHFPLSLGYEALATGRIEPQVIDPRDAPVRECLWQGEQADVARLPIVRHYAMDLGPVLTMTHIMKSQDGFYDISFAKTFYKRHPRHMVVSLYTRDLTRMAAEYERRNEPAPVVNVLGHHPAFYLGSMALTPWGNDDYLTLGSFLREPLRLTPSVTWGDSFLVPADAEVVIEGEIPPGQLDICDPFGEVAQLYQAQCVKPVFEVKAITGRRDAIMLDIFSGFRDSWNPGALQREGNLFNVLGARWSNVEAVHLPDSGCGRLACYVSLRSPEPGQTQEVGRAVLEQAAPLQCVVVVDAEIDVFDEREVLWAMQTYADPERGIRVHRDLPSAVFVTAWQGRKLVIDATRPRDVAFPARLEVPAEALAAVKLQEWLD